MAQHHHQRQHNALGLSYDFATEYRQHGLGMKFQVGIDSHWRIEPEIIYFFQSRNVTTLHLNANVQYAMPVVSTLQIYPFMGLSYSHWGYDGPNANRWGANLGAGVEVGLSDNWTAFAEFRFMLVPKETQAISAIGLKRRF